MIKHTVQTYNSGYLALGGDRLFAVSEGMTFRGKATGGVTSYSIHPDGSLTETGWQFTDGQRPCCICANAEGTEICISNFYGGLLHAYPVAPDGAIGEARFTIDEENIIPMKALHCVGLLPGEKVYGVISLSRMSLILYDAASGARICEYFPGPGNHPRHFASSPDGNTLYLLMQGPPVIHVLQFNGSDLALQQIAPLTETPIVFGASAVRVSPDGKYVIAALREDDTLYVYKVVEEGLELINTEKLPGRVPRDFNFTPDGKFVISALQYSDQVSIHRFDNGSLELCMVLDDIPSPASVVSRMAE